MSNKVIMILIDIVSSAAPTAWGSTGASADSADTSLHVQCSLSDVNTAPPDSGGERPPTSGILASPDNQRVCVFVGERKEWFLEFE